MNAISAIAAPVAFSIAAWNDVRYMLLEAIQRLNGTHTEEDVVAMLLAGRMGLWVGNKCAAVTEIVLNGRLKEMNVFIAGGDLDGLTQLKSAWESHGRQHGCDRTTIHGRKGWERIHSDYEFCGVKLAKDL